MVWVILEGVYSRKNVLTILTMPFDRYIKVGSIDILENISSMRAVDVGM